MTAITDVLIARILAESPLSLNAAARMLGEGRGGRPMSPVTVFRWIVKGIGQPDGRRLKLEGVRIGGAWRTSRGALNRFLAASQPVELSNDSLIPTATERGRASKEAESELKSAGW